MTSMFRRNRVFANKFLLENILTIYLWMQCLLLKLDFMNQCPTINKIKGTM